MIGSSVEKRKKEKSSHGKILWYVSDVNIDQIFVEYWENLQISAMNLNTAFLCQTLPINHSTKYSSNI